MHVNSVCVARDEVLRLAVISTKSEHFLALSAKGFEGLTEGGGLRLPKNRSWYVNADDRHLGSDEVGSIEVSF